MSDPASVQAALGALISKPKPSEKLLAKPPFKFLYDVVIAVKDATGFGADGVFTADELSAAPEDKDAKIAFLQKIIDYTVAKTGTSLAVKPQKIIAGLEPENTCAWLAALAQGGVDAKAAAAAPAKGKGKKAAAAEEAPAEKEGKKSKKKGDDAPAEDKKGAKKGKAADKEDGKAKKGKAAEKEDGKSKKKAASKEKAADDGDKKKKKKTAEKEAEPALEPEPEPEPPMRSAPPEPEPEPPARSDEPPPPPPSDPAPSGGPAAADEKREPPPRPQTARPPPPRIQSNVRTVEKTKLDVSTSQNQASSLIVDGDEQEDEESIDLGEDDEDGQRGGAGGNDDDKGQTDLSNIDTAGAGALVRGMIGDTEQLTSEVRENRTRTKIDASADNSLASKHQKEQLQKEVASLRESIQIVCRSANPLGKLMDYVQEDFENMSKELDNWKSESASQLDRFESEQRATEQSLQPLYAELTKLEQTIKEVQRKVNQAKANVERNDEHIAKLLRMVVNR